MALKLKSSAGKERVGRGMANLLALDFATSGIKAVRLKKTKTGIALVAADILPPSAPNATEPPELVKPLAAYYPALCATMDNVILRIFTQPLPTDENIEALVRENLSTGSADFRVSGVVLSRTKRDGTVLGVAVPEKTVRHYLSLFAEGAPAPRSLEISGLAAFNAFLFNCGKQTENQTVCLIETGTRYTYAAFLHRNQIQLVNRFDIGGETLERQVQTALGVDEEMAGAILSGASAINVSAPVNQILGPFIRQISIYREFIERQNKSSLAAVYISGGQAKSPYWHSAIAEVLGVKPLVWNPFEKIEIQQGTFPENLEGQESRFAASVGAALAGMEAL